MNDPGTEREREDSRQLLRMTVEVVSSYLRNNPLRADEICNLIRQVHDGLAEIARSEPKEPERPEPAVPIRRSVTPDYIICLEDGMKLKMLKRHLHTTYNLTPEQYRERWGLPRDYPMVAPNYARQRAELAKQIGLGSQRKRSGGRSGGRGRSSEAAD